jgi:hypothetical protein
MNDKQDGAPDSKAARVALWCALHVEIDPPPHVLEEEIGLKLLDLARRYFAGRRGGLRPPNNSEELLVATTGS